MWILRRLRIDGWLQDLGWRILSTLLRCGRHHGRNVGATAKPIRRKRARPSDIWQPICVLPTTDCELRLVRACCRPEADASSRRRGHKQPPTPSQVLGCDYAGTTTTRSESLQQSVDATHCVRSSLPLRCSFPPSATAGKRSRQRPVHTLTRSCKVL